MARLRPFPLALLITTLLLAFFLIAFPPYWGGNDDVGLSMIAHGYGLAATPSPHILFPNIVWGRLAQLIPTIHGVHGYAILALLSLLVSATVIGWAMLRLSIDPIVAVLLLAIILAAPAIFPQFTLISGLYAVASVLALLVYVREGQGRSLVIAVLLGITAYIVRDREALLVGLGALPFLPWNRLRHDRNLWIALLAFLATIGALTVVDRQAYTTPEWREYKAFDKVRLPFTDFSGMQFALGRPDILSRAGMTRNDITLIGNWFFLDPNITKPERLQQVLDELGPIALQPGSAGQSSIGLRALGHPLMLPLVLPLLLLGWMTRSRKLMAGAAIIIIAQFTFSLLGRFGALHVYMPMMWLLLIAGIAIAGAPPRPIRRAGIAVLALAFAATLYQLADSHAYGDARRAEIEKVLPQLPDEPLLTWGTAFPWEYIYPVLGREAQDLKLYTLGTFIHAPNARARQLENEGFHAWERLQSPDGVLIAAYRDQLDLLVPYCREHFGRRLDTKTLFETEAFSVYRIACVE